MSVCPPVPAGGVFVPCDPLSLGGGLFAGGVLSPGGGVDEPCEPEPGLGTPGAAWASTRAVIVEVSALPALSVASLWTVYVASLVKAETGIVYDQPVPLSTARLKTGVVLRKAVPSQ